MKLDIRFRGLDSSASLREHAMRRMQAHLARYRRELSSLVVRVVDDNGPKGGVDKRCLITVRGPRVGYASIEERSPDVYAAVDVAVERLARTLGRGVERARETVTMGAARAR
jgi:ribosomal subunit interface protein